MVQTQQLRPTPPPLPATPEEMEALRSLQKEKPLREHIEPIVLKLISDEDYKKLIWAIYPEQCVEGSFDADDVMAAQMIRLYAKDNSIPEVASQKLSAIDKSHRQALRKFHLTRDQRRDMAQEPVIHGTAPDETALGNA
jgi:hypothetical protein